MAAPFEVVLYGDQSTDYHKSLTALIAESKQSYLLREFLAVSWTRLSDAVRHLPYAERSPFLSNGFGAVGERSQKAQRKSLAVSCVLQTVVQIGLTILRRDREAESCRSKQNIRVHVTGLCTGIISAIAASIAESTADLIKISPEFVLLSLRLGLAASARGASIDDAEGAWSVVVSGMSSQTVSALIVRFHLSVEIPLHQRVYISAESLTSLTISGPPRVLEQFLSTNAMASTNKMTIPIWGPFHAKHLKLPDVDQIISDSKLWNRTLADSLPLISPCMTRHGRHPRSLRDLLQNALYGVLQAPIMMEELFQDLKREAGDRSIEIDLIGPGRLAGPFNMARAVRTSDSGNGRQNAVNDSERTFGGDEAIAIIGMAGKFPGAEDLNDLWKIIIEGQDLHRKVPLSRFDVQSHCDPTGKVRNTSLTPYGCFYDNADRFDCALFKMSPREAAQTDPIQRLMLITAFMALESAGYYDPGPRRPRPRFGTYYGQSSDDYRQKNSSQDVDSNYITGGIRAFGPGRVGYHFGWEGPSLTVDTACSASGVAIQQAVSALRLKECDAALTGGANFLSCSDVFAGLSRANFLSLTGGCKTLDETADGYCRADAVATVILKRLSDAIRDKDNILGLIRGIETNHAANAISITHPHAETQTALFRSVIRSAGLTIDDIDHVEMHGTGTQAGDVAETTSIASLLEGKRRPDDHPLFLGAVKPNVGHSEAASGVTSLMKGVLMLRNQVIPRFTGVKTRLNPKLPPLQALNICVPTENLSYTLADLSKKRRMLVNNFNATGGTTTLLLEEYHQTKTTRADPRDYFPITLSGATARALISSIEALHGLLVQKPDTVLSHLSYTLTARRMHHSHRFSCTAATSSELVRKLEATLTSGIRPVKCMRGPAVIFVFTGQGSCYASMGHLLWRTCRTFRSHVESADLLGQSLGFPSFLPVIRDSRTEIQDFDTVQIQLALVALEVALARTLSTWGVEPIAVVGHSLGEYSALIVSGVLSLADALYLVGKRAEFMSSKCKRRCSMLAVAASEDETHNAILTAQLPKSEIACINGPTQTVVSGPSIEITHLQHYLRQKRIKSTVLKTDYAFHSAQMDPILSEFRQIAASIHFRAPRISIASTLLGTIVEDGTQATFGAEYLARQTREPVQFTNALEQLHNASPENKSAIWVELGPSNTCLSMVASTLGVDMGRLTSMLDPKRSNWQSTSEAMSKIHQHGGDVFWDEYHKEYLDCLELIDVPAYSFDLTSHFIPYSGNWAITKDQRTGNRSMSEHVLQSATVHDVESYTTNADGREMHFVTDVSRGEFQDLLTVYRATSTLAGATWLLTDMAMTAASHLWQHENPKGMLPAVEISPVTGREGIMEALRHATTVRLVVLQGWSSSHTFRVGITIQGPESRHESKFEVVYDGANEWLRTLNKTSYLYQSRIQYFESAVRQGTTKVVELGRTTQLLDDANWTESVATLRLDKTPSRFALNPAWHAELIGVVDRMFHHGHTTRTAAHAEHEFTSWRRLRLLRPLPPVPGTYHVHARLQAASDPAPVLGDIHVLDANHDIVAVVEDMEYHRTLASNTTTAAAVSRSSSYPSPAATTATPSPGPPTGSHTSHASTRTSPSSVAASPALDFDAVLAVLTAEIGVDPASVRDDSLFADLGVDSILQIAVTARLREHVRRDLPEGLLMEHASVRALRGFMEGLFGGVGVEGGGGGGLVVAAAAVGGEEEEVGGGEAR